MTWLIGAVAMFDLAAVALLVAGHHPREPRPRPLSGALADKGKRHKFLTNRRSASRAATSTANRSLRLRH